MVENTLIIIVGSQAAVVVGKIVFDWLSNRRNGINPGTLAKINTMERIISEVDGDGSPMVYFPRSLVKTFDEMLKELQCIKNEVKK